MLKVSPNEKELKNSMETLAKGGELLLRSTGGFVRYTAESLVRFSGFKASHKSVLCRQEYVL